MTVPFQYNFLGLQLDIYLRGAHQSREVGHQLKGNGPVLQGKCCYLIHPPKQLIIHNTRCRWVRSNTCTYLQCKLTTIIRDTGSTVHQITGSSFEELSGSDILRLLPTYPTERMEFLTKVQMKLYKDRNVSNTLKTNEKSMHFQLY